jgi:hydroxypyruvate reductase
MTQAAQSATLSDLEYSRGKQLAIQVFLDTLASLDVRSAMLAKLKREGELLKAGEFSLPLARLPHVVAFGKAANRMATVLDDILGGRVEAGVCVSPGEPARKLDRFRYFLGGHPYPQAGTLEGARAALELVSNLTPDDAVIFLVSGGGSAIFEQPFDSAVSLSDLREFNRLLVTCGLPIEQINVLRKHTSAVKGGRLAVRAYPAQQLTIYISDVPEQLSSMVASGPTLPDESTAEQAYALAEQNGLVSHFPPSIRKRFLEHTLEETPKPGDERFKNSHYFCLLSNRDAVEAARTAAEKLGFVSEIDSSPWDVDYRQVAQSNLVSLKALADTQKGHPVCSIVGGEVTCRVTGPGVGGRNQAYVLYAAQSIAGQHRVVLSAGTDGRDGNSPTSGAVADGQTVSRAQVLGLDPAWYLAESDSYSFFRTLGDTVDIGYMDNNLRDVRIWLDLSNPLQDDEEAVPPRRVSRKDGVGEIHFEF